MAIALSSPWSPKGAQSELRLASSGFVSLDPTRRCMGLQRQLLAADSYRARGAVYGSYMAYQFSTDEVFIRREGDNVVLSPKPRDWRTYLASAPAASDAFMAGVEDLPVQEREA